MPLISTGDISLKLAKHFISCQTTHCFILSHPLSLSSLSLNPLVSRPTVSSCSRHWYSPPVISSLTSQRPGSAFWILHIRWFAGCCFWFWCARFNTKPPPPPPPPTPPPLFFHPPPTPPPQSPTLIPSVCHHTSPKADRTHHHSMLRCLISQLMRLIPITPLHLKWFPAHELLSLMEIPSL